MQPFQYQILNLAGVRQAPRALFGVDQLAGHAHLEGAEHIRRLDADAGSARVIQRLQTGCQTGSLLFKASGVAVGDDDIQQHVSLLVDIDRIINDESRQWRRLTVKSGLMTVEPFHIPVCKRVLDVLLALMAMLLLAPLVLLMVVVLLIQQGPPLLFCQMRPGLGGRLFRLCKFRTMWEAHTPYGTLLPDEARITPLGRLLRRTSLDELPELLNVLKGEMSWVGPRPLLPQYLARYSDRQARRHEVLPGITGWAQVNGRNAISWEQKFELDVWYVENWSLWLDVRILLMTVGKVISGEGISQPGYETMPEFMGSGENRRQT